MKTEKTWFWSRSAAVFEWFLILCMIYGAANLVNLYAGWELQMQMIMIFAALCGGIYLVVSRQEGHGLSWLFLTVLLVISLWAFRSRGLAGEILAGFGGFFVCRGIHGKPILRRVYVAAAVCGLIGAFINDLPLSRWLIAVVLLLGFREIVSLHQEEFGIPLMPLLLVLICGVLMLPVRNYPINWSIFTKPIAYAGNLLGDLFADLSYHWPGTDSGDRFIAGYSDLARMGSSLSGSNKEELYLSLKTSSTGIYLEGQTYNRLEGTHWKNDREDLQSYNIWYLAYLNALYQNKISPETASCFSRVRSMEVTFGYLRTRDLIRPANLLKVSCKEDLEESNGLSFAEEKGRGYQYRVTYMDFDYANPYLTKLLEECTKEGCPLASYEELNRYSGKLYAVLLEDVVSKAEYRNYEKSQAAYDVEPWLEVSGVTARVETLAKEITADCENDYDKCKAIERFLREYTYNTRVVYREADSLIDSFLFGKQEGYCVHYTSAMVMLLRLNGIPARFVNGYYCNYSQQNEDKDYVITGNCAHTWPEAYIAGYGWIRLEPTAAYYDANDRSWGLLVESDRQKTASDEWKIEGEETEIELPEVTAKIEKDHSPWKIMILLVFLLLVLYLLAFGWIYRRRKLRRYERAVPEAKLHMLLEDVCWLIQNSNSEEGVSWEELSLLDYGKWMPENRLREKLKDTVMAYYGAHYGKKEITEEALCEAAKLHEELRASYLQKVSGYRQRIRKLSLYLRLAVITVE